MHGHPLSAAHVRPPAVLPGVQLRQRALLRRGDGHLGGGGARGAGERGLRQAAGQDGRLHRRARGRHADVGGGHYGEQRQALRGAADRPGALRLPHRRHRAHRQKIGRCPGGRNRRALARKSGAQCCGLPKCFICLPPRALCQVPVFSLPLSLSPSFSEAATATRTRWFAKLHISPLYSFGETRPPSAAGALARQTPAALLS
mmetsp:Transcript_18551/g.47414  ORF Transcript_18551/g.47414 Transcript_18551/m.47414 type:complete len:202 (+) Transcript_18551:1537-2142(+)